MRMLSRKSIAVPIRITRFKTRILFRTKGKTLNKSSKSNGILRKFYENCRLIPPCSDRFFLQIDVNSPPFSLRHTCVKPASFFSGNVTLRFNPGESIVVLTTVSFACTKLFIKVTGTLSRQYNNEVVSRIVKRCYSFKTLKADLCTPSDHYSLVDCCWFYRLLKLLYKISRRRLRVHLCALSSRMKWFLLLRINKELHFLVWFSFTKRFIIDEWSEKFYVSFQRK